MSGRWNRDLKKASAVLLALVMGTAALPNTLPACAAEETIVPTESVGNQEAAAETGNSTLGAAGGSLETVPETGDSTKASQETSDGLSGTTEDRTEALQVAGDSLPAATDGEASGRADESVVGEGDQSGLVIEDGEDGVSDIASEETPGVIHRGSACHDDGDSADSGPAERTRPDCPDAARFRLPSEGSPGFQECPEWQFICIFLPARGECKGDL